MNRHHPFTLSILAAPLLAAVASQAQTFTNLHTFGPTQIGSTGLYANSVGGNPYARMVLSGTTLYGTAAGYDTHGLGGLFRINTDGSGFTNLLAFNINGSMTNGSNGSNPFGGLLLVDNVLYGTTRNGGTNYNGTVFSIHTDGTGFNAVFNFGGTSGAAPYSQLFLTNNTLYGTTTGGGAHSAGTLFQIKVDGTGFTGFMTSRPLCIAVRPIPTALEPNLGLAW